jgi:thiol-disulfide isomerase/thioredoxin
VNPKNRTFAIVGAVVALILIAAGIAVVASGGDDSDAGGSEVTTESGPVGSTAAGTVEENRPVELTGEILISYPDPPATDPAIGMASPVVAGQSFDGTPLTIGGPGEGPTLLVFLAHWCPHCNAEVPELIALQDGGDIPAELRVVGISTAVAPDRPNYPPSQWVVDKGWPWPTVADDAESNAFLDFGGTGFPFLVMLDADGTVLARQSGESSADEIKAWIVATLATAKA